MGRYNWRFDYEIRTITRVGNSFMVALPRHYLERLGLKKGDEVSIEKLGASGPVWAGLAIKPIKKGGNNGGD